MCLTKRNTAYFIQRCLFLRSAYFRDMVNQDVIEICAAHLSHSSWVMQYECISHTSVTLKNLKIRHFKQTVKDKQITESHLQIPESLRLIQIWQFQRDNIFTDIYLILFIQARSGKFKTFSDNFDIGALNQ